MGDTRGIQVDKKNFENTIAYLKTFTHLNAICFLIKPNVKRLSPAFRYCFRELFIHLNKRSVRNICFCFTNTRGTNYGPGDTIEPLIAYLDEIQQQQSDVRIELTKDNVFCFDNEAFRYLMLIKDKETSRVLHINPDERQQFSNSWRKSSDTSTRLVQFIKSLPEMKVLDLVTFNENQQKSQTYAVRVRDVLRNLVELKAELRDSIKTDKSQAKRKQPRLDRVDKDLSSLWQLNAQVFNSIRAKSVSVCNDDLEAYLDEMQRAEYSYSDQMLSSGLAKEYEAVLKEYRNFKKSLISSISSSSGSISSKSVPSKKGADVQPKKKPQSTTEDLFDELNTLLGEIESKLKQNYKTSTWVVKTQKLLRENNWKLTFFMNTFMSILLFFILIVNTKVEEFSTFILEKLLLLLIYLQTQEIVLARCIA